MHVHIIQFIAFVIKRDEFCHYNCKIMAKCDIYDRQFLDKAVTLQVMYIPLKNSTVQTYVLLLGYTYKSHRYMYSTVSYWDSDGKVTSFEGISGSKSIVSH